MGRQLADEADSVGHEERQVVDDDFPDGGVESREELVLGKDGALGERVHESALPDIGVADESDSDELAPVLPLGAHLPVNVSEFLFEERYPVEDYSPVGLNLLLARSSHADAALLPLEVRP